MSGKGLEAVGGGSQEFGGAGQVPVRVTGLGMPEPGRQDRQDRGRVGAGVVGVQHRGDRERMSKIMQAGSAEGGCRGQAGLVGQGTKDRVHQLREQSGASQGDQQSGTAGRGWEPVSLS